MTRVVRLAFLLSHKRRMAGSALMRGPQLQQIVAPFLRSEIETRVAYLPSARFPLLQSLWARAQPSGTIFRVTKPAIQRLSPETAIILRRRGCSLCFDPVDSSPELGAVAPDAYIASSYTQARLLGALKAAGKLPEVPVATVLHNADARFHAGPAKTNHSTFSAAYFGLPELTHIPTALRPAVTVFSASIPAQVEAAVKRLPGFSLHFACRNDDSLAKGIVKPFTKGVTAAVLGANVVTGRDVPDAIEMLGADYPYLVPGPTDQDIVETFARARSDFGGMEWLRAAETMRSVAALVSPQALALQIDQLISELET